MSLDQKIREHDEWYNSLSDADRAHFASCRRKIEETYRRDPKPSHTFEELGFTADEERVFRSQPRAKRVPGGLLQNPTFGPTSEGNPCPTPTAKPSGD